MTPITDAANADPLRVELWTAPNLAALPRVRHGFTTRAGGVSTPPFDTLNLGLHVGDDPACVAENRRRAASALGFKLSCMVCAAQVHDAGIAVVTDADAGRGTLALSDALPGVDALVTDTPNLLLTLLFADCVPVFFAGVGARGQMVVGLAHAGWRGLVAGVLENTVQAIEDRFGAKSGSLRVAIGPHIGAAHFEVGEEVAGRFPAFAIRRPDPAGRPHIDLRVATHLRLVASHVPRTQIYASDDCTAADKNCYFSHRREGGRTGRMAAMIGISDATAIAALD